VVAIVDRLDSNPAVYLTKAGHWTTYEAWPSYRVRRGQRIDPVAAANDRGVAAPPVQVRIVSAFDLALFSLGMLGALRHRNAFNAAAP
jgi:hypothetical protein